MSNESNNKLQNIEAEDLELINTYISKFEIKLLNKFPETSVEKIVRIERERIFEDIEFSEMIDNEFNIREILREREATFSKELRSNEENQIIPIYGWRRFRSKFRPKNKKVNNETLKSPEALPLTSTSPRRKDYLINVKVDKKALKQYVSLKRRLINLKNIALAGLLVGFGSFTIYLERTSTISHPNLPHHVDKFLDDYITLLTIISSVLLVMFGLSLVYHLYLWIHRRPSTKIVYYLGVKGNSIYQSELYYPPSSFDKEKYLSILGELIYREIVSTEYIG